MTEKEIIREIMALRGWSQEKLAHEAGFKSQSNITGLLNNNFNGIRIDNLLSIFKAMGCKIIIRDNMGTEKEWIIDHVDRKERPEKPKRSKIKKTPETTDITEPIKKELDSTEKPVIPPKQSGPRIKLPKVTTPPEPYYDLSSILKEDDE